MDEILGIAAPASLLLLGFGIMAFLLIRDRRERARLSDRVEALPPGQIVEIRETSKG